MWVKNDTANPTHSFKDRVVSVALEKAKQLGYEVVACASTGNLANSVAAHASAHGLESYVFVPADLEEQKIVATAVYGTTLLAVEGNYDDVNRLCMELAERPALGVRQRQRAAVLQPRARRRSPTRSPSSSAGACPTAASCPIASGSLYTKINRGFRDLLETGLVEGELPVLNGAQAAGCGPGGRRLRGRASTSSRRCDPTPSPRASPSATRPTASSRSTSRARPAAPISAVTEEEIVEGIELLARTTGHLHRDRRRRHHRRAHQARAPPGQIDPDERVVVYITGDGLKTLDAVADRVERHPIEPTVASFEAAIGEARLIA